jgi:spore germination protein YaaH
MPTKVKNRLNQIVIDCALAVAAGAFSPAVLSAQGQFERLFYYVDREDSYRSLVRNIDQITIVAPQVYVVDSLGIMWGALDKRVIELAKAHHVKVMPLFTNEGFNGPALRRLLSDSLALARSVKTMVDLCKANGYWGIQFDVENLNIADRDRFTEWYTDAANALHAGGFTISAAVVHRTDDDAGPTAYHRFLQDSWRAGYDLSAMARVGDFISVMTYSEHTRRTPPGPVAGLPWVHDVVDYFLRFVPPEKLSLGIPTYGMHWFTRYNPAIPERADSWNESVSWSWGSGLAERNGAKVQWDAAQSVPFASYSVGGVNDWVFLEDVRSFRAKLDLAHRKRLRGFSVWVLGPEDERIWDVLRNDSRSR